jgi:hypothetical protein
MPKNRTFRESEIESIVGIIRAWPKERITWSDVCARAEPLLGFMPSRQGLYQREEIRNAFQAKQKGLRISPKATVPMPSSLAVASMRISNLNAQIREQNLIINRMRDQFIRWQYNAYLKGVSEADLEKPLPGADREVQQPVPKDKGRRK